MKNCSTHSVNNIVLKLFYHHNTFVKKKAMGDIKKFMGGEQTFCERSWGTVRLTRLGYVRVAHGNGYVSEWEFAFHSKHFLNKRKLQVPSAMDVLIKRADRYQDDIQNFNKNPDSWQDREIDFGELKYD